MAYRNNNRSVSTKNYLGKCIALGSYKKAYDIDKQIVALRPRQDVFYPNIFSEGEHFSESEQYFDLIIKELAFHNQTLADHIKKLYAKNIFYDKQLMLAEKGIMLKTWLLYPAYPNGKKLSPHKKEDQKFYHQTILKIIKFIEYDYYLYSQTNYIHCDVKVENIVLKAYHRQWLPKMIDKDDIRVNNDFSRSKHTSATKKYQDPLTHKAVRIERDKNMLGLLHTRITFESSKNTVIDIVSLAKFRYYLEKMALTLKMIDHYLLPYIASEDKRKELIGQKNHTQEQIDLIKKSYKKRDTVCLIDPNIEKIKKCIDNLLKYLVNFCQQFCKENTSHSKITVIFFENFKKQCDKISESLGDHNAVDELIINKTNQLTKRINKDCDNVIRIQRKYPHYIDYNPKQTWNQFQQKRHSNWKKIKNNEFINQFREKDKIGQTLAKINDILSIIQQQRMNKNKIQCIQRILQKFVIMIRHYYHSSPSPFIEKKRKELIDELQKNILQFIRNNKLNSKENQITDILNSIPEIKIENNNNTVDTMEEYKDLELKEEKNQCSSRQDLFSLVNDTKKPFYKDLLGILIKIIDLKTMVAIQSKSSLKNTNLVDNKKPSWIPTLLNIFEAIMVFRQNYKESRDILKEELSLIKDILHQLFSDYKPIRDKIDNLINNDSSLEIVEHKIKTIYKFTYFMIEN